MVVLSSIFRHDTGFESSSKTTLTHAPLISTMVPCFPLYASLSPMKRTFFPTSKSSEDSVFVSSFLSTLSIQMKLSFTSSFSDSGANSSTTSSVWASVFFATCTNLGSGACSISANNSVNKFSFPFIFSTSFSILSSITIITPLCDSP